MNTEKNLRALFTKRWHVRELDTYPDSPVYGEWILGVYSVQVYGATSGVGKSHFVREHGSRLRLSDSDSSATESPPARIWTHSRGVRNARGRRRDIPKRILRELFA
jgi:hypothetical protein